MNDSFQTKAYVVQSKNTELLEKCTSGGVFTTIALQFMQDGGFVCGAVYGDDFEVKHIISNHTADVERFAGSKYVQSNLGNVFQDIKKLLDDGKKLLFCGTPCQVAGLKKYLDLSRTKTEKLYLIDLVCHGVPSPKLWTLYLDYSNQKRGRLSYVNFRSKYLGYHTSVMEEINAEGKRYVGSARTHLMSKIFFRNIADRKSCYECAFKTVERVSDITIFDSWHAKELVDGLKDKDNGYTNVVLQSAKGATLLNQYAESFNIFPCNLDDAIRLDGVMATNSVKKHPQRDEFYEYLYKNGIEKTIDKFLPISKKDYLIEKIKVILKRR